MEDLTYYANDEQIGEGIEGFKRVIKTLETLENGSRYKIVFSSAAWNEDTSDDPKFLEPFPFKAHQQLRSQFEETMRAKRLSYELRGY